MKPRLLLVGSLVAIASASWAGQMDEDRNPDPPLSTEQLQLVAKLSAVEVERIDRALLENSSRGWRKVARVVGTTMMDLKPRPPGIPDLYYSQRITKLVEEGKLESAGNLQFMRYSEVRLREQ